MRTNEFIIHSKNVLIKNKIPSIIFVLNVWRGIMRNCLPILAVVSLRASRRDRMREVPFAIFLNTTSKTFLINLGMILPPIWNICLVISKPIVLVLNKRDIKSVHTALNQFQILSAVHKSCLNLLQYFFRFDCERYSNFISRLYGNCCSKLAEGKFLSNLTRGKMESI